MRTFPKSTEQIQDIVAALLQAGTGISIVYNDAGNALTINATGGGGGSLTVREVDGTPSGTVNTIVFPNSTVAIVDNVATITGLQGPQGIQGIQGIQGNPGPAGPNLINASTATTLNGFLTGNGSTVVVTQYGTTAGTVCQGNDARLSDARTPLAHPHGNITNAGAIGATANLPLITGAGGVVTTGSFGTGANTFCQGNDARLSDARTPLAHNQAWSTITSTPTTLAGYGITDAQPSNGGLTSLASASATNAIYYRSAADTWSVVTIGANLSFTAGTLAATGGGSTTDASLLTTGTLADARLSSNIPRLNASNTFSVDQTFSGQVTVGSNLFGASIWVMNSNSLTLNSGSNNTYIQQSGNTLFVSNYGGANAVTRWYQNANEVMQLRNDLSAEFFGNVTVQGWLDARLRPFTVAGLPLASANARRELWVTDSTLAMLPANYGTTVAGGGSNGARVISNGTNWIIA